MLITSLQNAVKKILTNRIFKTVVIIIMLFNILFASIGSSFAVEFADMSDVSVPLTVERAGNYVANFGINFETNFNSKSQYSDVTTEIGDTYNGNDVSGKYCFSNASWIGFVYNQCLKVYSNSSIGTMTANSYVTPHTKSTNATWNETFFEQVKFYGDAYALEPGETEGTEVKTENLNIATLATNDEICPGDILIKRKYAQPKAGEPDTDYIGEVFLYIGAGQVIYCKKPETDADKKTLVKCYLDDLDCKIDTVLRIKEDTAKKVKDMDTTLIFAGKGYDAKITYQGIPGSGTYLGTSNTGFFRWIIDKISNILDYLVGIVTYAIRAVLIGWTNLVENLIHDTLLGSVEDADGDKYSTIDNKVANDLDNNQLNKLAHRQPNGSYVNSLTGKANNLDSRVSIEEIIFNRIPILDVNFFGVEKAGGSEIAQGSIIYMLRQNIANWYYIIRLISIILMLFILIYVGLRIALTTTGGKKAQYKSALSGWLIGFIAVIAVHLFIYVIFQINEYLVSLFEQTALKMNGGEFSLYETIRTKSYAPKFTEGFGSTVIYMFLVYMLIRFTVIYFKRYLTVTILGLIGPVIGLKYGVERATGKKTKSIANWMFEFSMNVLLQAVHALLYVCLMQIALSMAFDSLSGYVVALVILNFMMGADKIFMKIFSFDRSKSVGDTVQPEGMVQQFAKITWGAALTAKATRNFGKGVIGIGSALGRGRDWIGDTWYNDRKEGDTKKKHQNRRYAIAGKVGRGLNFATGNKISTLAALSLLQGKPTSKKMDKAAIDAIKINFKLSQKEYKRTLKAVKAVAGGALKTATAIPITIADPMAGIGMAYGAYSGIKNNIDRTAIKNAKLQEAYEDYIDHSDDTDRQKKTRKAIKQVERFATAPARGSAALASFRGKAISESAKFDIDKYEDSRMKNHKIIEQLKKANVTEKEIDKLYKELETEISKTSSGLTSEQLTKTVNKVFSDTAKEALTKRVTSSSVKGAVEQYMSQNDLKQLSELDIDNIMEIIKRKESENGKKLVFDNDVMDNVREALQQRVDANALRKHRRIILSSDMQQALKKGLAKQGSIKSDKVDSTKGTKEEEIKARIQENIRKYENLYEGSGKKVEEARTVINRAQGQDKKDK